MAAAAVTSFPDEKSQHISGAFDDTEKTHQCSVHTGDETKQLDKQLQQPNIKAFLQSLINSLEAINDETQCTKCAVEASTEVLSSHMEILRAAKKSGHWTKDEKKALKSELKVLSKGIKKDMKAKKGKSSSWF